MATGLRRIARRVRRLGRDQRGGALEYMLVLAVLVIPLMALMSKLFDLLTDYYQMLAFFVAWPFL